MNEKISPKYYNDFNLPFIREAGLLRGFCLGNAIKYIDRAGKKEGQSEKLDLLKAAQYLKIYLSEVYGADYEQEFSQEPVSPKEYETLFRNEREG